MRRALWLALGSLLVIPAIALAQTGTVVGSVVDASGAPVEGARVCIKTDGCGCLQQVNTDDQGNFTFDEVPVGVYVIKASKMGVGMGTATDVEVIEGQVTEVPPIALGCSGGGGHGGGGGTCPQGKPKMQEDDGN